MSSKTLLTEYASAAGHELFQLSFICEQIDGDIMDDERVLRARHAGSPDAPLITNEPFNNAASRFLGILQFCRSVDLYNWYCCQALKLALSSNPKPILKMIRKKGGRVAKTILKADKMQRDVAAEVIREFLADRYKGDRIIREIIHCDLDVTQNPEVELICTCRNILVHKRGHDEFGEIKEGIQKLGSKRAFIGAQWYPCGHMPIALDNGAYLIIDMAVGNWVVELMRQQIFTMDQNFAHVYKLPRKNWDSPSIGRRF